MNKNCIKQLSAISLGIFLMSVAPLFGQILSEPTSNKVVLDGKNLYEHGYNSTGEDLSREGVDTVMVGSKMNYFVMPDTYYNKAYFQQNNYFATNLTKSKFEWTVANGTFAHQSPNTATSPGTSPWIKVTWGSTLGATTITMKEIPQGLTAACDGEETTIPVFVIAKPTIGFNQVAGEYAAADCYDDVTKLSAFYDFPVLVTTSSSQVLVDYSIKRTNLQGSSTDLPDVTGAVVSSSGLLQIPFNDYGEYEITITKITDRIARKCDDEGSINSGAEVFTYSVLPKPKAGKAYHVPNHFE